MNAPEYAEDNRPLTNYGARRIVWLVVFLIVGGFILRSLHSVLLLFVVVFLTAMVLNPIVVWLEGRGVPRAASAILLVLVGVSLAASIAVFATPLLTKQVQDLVRRAPDLWQAIRLQIETFTHRYPSVADALPQTDEIAGKVGAQAGAVANPSPFSGRKRKATPPAPLKSACR
jgi:putative permease